MASSGEGVVNVVLAGLGGQGVVKASNILSHAAFLTGLDVKKSEIHGMSQRGGSVSSDVRFGGKVNSPMVPRGEADYLVILEETQVEPNIHMLRTGGRLITPAYAPHLAEDDGSPEAALRRRMLNVGLLGSLSAYLPAIPRANWLASVRANVPPRFADENCRVFLAAHAMELILAGRIV